MSVRLIDWAQDPTVVVWVDPGTLFKIDVFARVSRKDGQITDSFNVYKKKTEVVSIQKRDDIEDDKFLCESNKYGPL